MGGLFELNSYKLYRADGCLSSSETFPPVGQGKQCFGENGHSTCWPTSTGKGIGVPHLHILTHKLIVWSSSNL